MHKLFVKIERNNYLPKETAGHGFDGWFQTNMASRAGNGMSGGPFGGGGSGANNVMKAIAEALNLTSPVATLLQEDPNALIPNRDQTAGIYGLVQHQYANGGRYSSRDYVQEAVRNGTSKITLSVNSLATRVLFDTASKCGGAKPRATGVEYLEGKSLYAADPRRDPKTQGTKKVVTAKREVIVSGGTFNSPQILMLSGIGPKAELEKLNITVVKDLAGVGHNLMDNQEMPIVGQTPAGAAAGTGAGSGATGVAMLKTDHPAYGERDMFIMQGPYVFRGFWPSNQTAQLPPEVSGVYGVSMVKNHPVNTKGWVKLRTANPVDTPDINFNLYAEGGETDLGAMKDTIAFIRTIYKKLGMTPREPPCSGTLDSKGYCDIVKDDEEWIKKQTFGHHPTSTCRIGADSDPMAVLDSKFRVRGVDGLRVVDASAFTRIPGVFPSVSTFMISQKASDDMIAELADGKAIKACSAA
jgi:choline dehydrogenase